MAMTAIIMLMPYKVMIFMMLVDLDIVYKTSRCQKRSEDVFCYQYILFIIVIEVKSIREKIITTITFACLLHL